MISAKDVLKKLKSRIELRKHKNFEEKMEMSTFPHIVKIYRSSYSSVEYMQEMITWCENNCKGNWKFSFDFDRDCGFDYFAFEYETDASLFALIGR